MALVVVAVLSHAQTAPTKKPPAPPEKPDIWQKSKECAAQAEKVMVDRQRTPPTITTWENHYSPKYNRCFLAILEIYSLLNGAGKDFGKYQWQLLDAFERSDIAATEWDGPPPSPGACRVEGEYVDCEIARKFIREHLKN
jgi:hypothetical protein